MAAGLPFATFSSCRPPVMVISHERSGTHFLMNSLARAYGYVAKPWTDFDHSRLAINFFHPPAVASTLEWWADHRIASVVKSHHAVEFFEEVLQQILRRYVVFYIHRDPVDVMASFWRCVRAWPWHEGPRRDDPLSFALAEPEGQLLRYQTRQRRHMLDRWATHVEGWHRASETHARLRCVAYSALRDDYAGTVNGFADLLERAVLDASPPPRGENVISGDSVAEHTDLSALRACVVSEVGHTMKQLGYV